MRTTGVIVRFLSLLDVAIILLGILLLAIAQAQMKAPKKKVSAGSEVLKETISNRFLYLYAGTSGDENGKCYHLGPDGRKLREVRTDVRDDIEQVLKATAPAREEGKRLVMLVVSPLGFDTEWPEKRLTKMEELWGLKIVPLYNLNLDNIR